MTKDRGKGSKKKKKIVEFSTKGGKGGSEVRFSTKQKKHGLKTLDFA